MSKRKGMSLSLYLYMPAAKAFEMTSSRLTKECPRGKELLDYTESKVTAYIIVFFTALFFPLDNFFYNRNRIKFVPPPKELAVHGGAFCSCQDSTVINKHASTLHLSHL